MNLTRRHALKLGSSLAASALAAPYVRAQGTPISIGVTLPFSGSQAQLGGAFNDGVISAVNLANKAGGVLGRQIELVQRDDKGTGAGAVAAAREIFDMDIKLLVGAFQSTSSLALAPILPENDAVLIGTGTAMSLTHESFNRNFFRGYSNSYMNFGGLGRACAQKHPDVSKWAFIGFDTAFGHDSLMSVTKGLAAVLKQPPTFSETVFVAPTASDFKVEIARLMQSDAEGIYMAMLGGPAITFLQQARGVGLAEKFKVIADGGNDTAIGIAMQQTTPKNIWCRGYWYPEHPLFSENPVSQEFYEEITTRTGKKDPISMAQCGHKVALAMIKAIKKSGSIETAAVIDGLEGLEFMAADGKNTIRKEDHQIHGTAYYGNVGPSDDAPFYKLQDVVVIDEKDTIEPAAPGVAFTL